jgi:hypothetical protein
MGLGPIIRADRTAQRALFAPRRIGSEGEIVLRRGRIQISQQCAGLGLRESRVRIDPVNRIHVSREIQDYGFVDGLPGEACSPTSGKNRNLANRTVLHDSSHIRRRPREHDTDRRHLVRARVRGIERAGVGIEPDIALDNPLEI